ncbi:MAG: hypothetical protein HRT37_13320 [Alteromonadaceae bacterium]|nr:hypothetical protein [Alteromonadaceae bacterium]
MKITNLIAGFALASSSMVINAQQVEVTVTNLTQGIHYTPFLISAHSADMSLYKLGQAASAELQMMAEGGDITGLSALLTNASADIIENPAGGLLAPAMSTTAMLDTSDGNTHLSLVSMLLPTNDAFVGLNAWEIPTEAGTYTFTLNAYDAGTEANDEMITGGGAPGAAGIPVAPGGDGGADGTGVTSQELNATVHIHRGSLGDDDISGGKSDLNNTVHRWLNPVARITVIVM